jgi:ATP/maltotriose-dependent transcriptional regulator MalT
MGDSDLREREGRTGGPVFDLTASKLRRPLVRHGTVRRSPLVERLANGDRRPIVSVVAPPGYGKTTVLAQWAERNGQSFAWVSVDERDNDPKVLLTYVAQALDAVEPIDERVFDALASPGSSVPGSVLPRLGSAFSSMTTPVALVLDDVHMLRNRECRRGVDQMRTDAELAARTLGAGSFWRTAATLYLGVAHLMAGDADRADVLFQDAAAAGQAGGASIGACVALAERSLLAISRGAWETAERHLSQARSLARDANLEDYPPVTILHAAAARIALHQHDRPRAIAELTRAQRLRPGLTYALPYLAVQARIELARCHLALADVAAARILLQEAEEVLTRHPGLGVFARQAGDLRAELSSARGSSAPGASALTAAELRLLPMLPTHLSFPQIGEEMFLSPNTVKSHAVSIYRKLGATSRSQAVTRSRELGLLEG